MEIINENKMPENEPKKNRKSDVSLSSGIYLGVILVCLGALWLFRNFGWVGYGVWDTVMSWQMLLVAIGGYLIAMRKWTAGTIIAGIGVIGFFMDYITMKISIGPLIVIAIGVALLVTKLTERGRK